MHSHQGDLSPQGPQAHQHRHAPRHHPHAEESDADLRVRGDGPEAVHGQLLWHDEYHQCQGMCLPLACTGVSGDLEGVS